MTRSTNRLTRRSICACATNWSTRATVHTSRHIRCRHTVRIKSGKHSLLMVSSGFWKLLLTFSVRYRCINKSLCSYYVLYVYVSLFIYTWNYSDIANFGYVYHTNGSEWRHGSKPRYFCSLNLSLTITANLHHNPNWPNQTLTLNYKTLSAPK